MSPFPCNKAPLTMAVGSAIAAMAVSPVALACSPDGSSTTFTVTNTDASGSGSFYWTLVEANANSGCDVIDFSVPAGSTIELDDALNNADDLYIKGPGADQLTVKPSSSATFDATLVSSDPGALTVSGFTLEGANESAFSADAGAYVLEDMVLNGGAEATVKIHHSDETTLDNVVITGAGRWGMNFQLNPSSVDGTRALSIRNTLITGNGGGSNSDGAGLYVAAPNNSGTTDHHTVRIENSTISNNTAQGTVSQGGGIYIDTEMVAPSAGEVDLEIFQSTISGNSAAYGGAVFADEESGYPVNIDIAHSTLTDNSASLTTGGIYNFTAGNVVLNHTIVAGNTDSVGTNPDLLGGFEVEYSFIGVDGNQATVNNDGHSVISGGDPQLLDLAALAELEGIELPREARVHVPGENSPVIDAGDLALQAGEGNTPETDQAGLPRVSLDGIDIGAVELPPEETVGGVVDDATGGGGSSAAGPGILALMMSALAFRRRR